MGFKRILWIFLFVCIAIAAALWSVRYYLLHKQSDLCSHIPYDASAVVYFNIRVLGQNLKTKDGFEKLRKTSPYFSQLKNPGETGIDFLSDAAWVHYHSYSYFLVQLKDAGALKTCIQESEPGLYSEIKKIAGYYRVTSLKDSFTLLWNEDLLVCLDKKSTNTFKERYTSIMGVESDKSFNSNPVCLKVRKNTAAIWFYSSKMPRKWFSSDTLAGSIEIDSSLKIFASDNIEKPLKTKLGFGNNADTIQYLYSKSKNSLLYRFLGDLATYYLSEHTKEKINTENYTEMSLYLGGLKVIEKTSIHYEYDEDFNRRQIIIKKTDSIKTACLYYTSVKKDSVSRICNFDGISIPKYQSPGNGILETAHFNNSVISGIFPFPSDFICDYTSESENNTVYYSFRLQSTDWKNTLKYVSRIIFR